MGAVRSVNGADLVGNDIPILDTRSAETKYLDHVQELAGALAQAFRTNNRDLIGATMELAVTHTGMAGALASLLSGLVAIIDKGAPGVLDAVLAHYGEPADCGDWCLNPPEPK